MSSVDSFRVFRRPLTGCRSISMFLLLSGTLAAGGCDGDKNPAGPSGFSGLSSFTHTLTVAMSPPAGGSIAKSPNLSQFASGASVTLTATPASGYQFTGWQGDASGATNPIAVKMDRNKTVTAAFAPVVPNQYTVTVATSPADGGTIARAPDQPQYPAGTTVTLTATPASGYQFAGWQEDATGSTNPITVTIDKNKNLMAAFSPTTPGHYTLTVSASPANGGTIARAPDQSQYPAGTTVTLTATAASGYQFTGWQGDATGSTNPITVTIDKNKSVTAAFASTTPNQYALTVSVSPANGGTVTRAPDQALYAAGTTVTLTATPATGHRFTGWQGDASGRTNPTTLVINANKSVTAAFVLFPAPSISAPSTSGFNYTVSVTYAETYPESVYYGMFLEESRGGSAFAQVGSRSGIISPFTVELTRSPGTYRYRARVLCGGVYSPYSPIVSTIVEAATSSTVFVNDTQDSFYMTSLKIDGIEKMLFAVHPVPPGNSFEVEVTPGFHTYTTENGFIVGGSRGTMYTRSGSYTQPLGALTIRVPGRTLEELLTPYSWTASCARDYWQKDVHQETYRFYSGGSFRLYRDGQLAVSGSLTFSGQDADQHLVYFAVDSGAGLYVTENFFAMGFDGYAYCEFHPETPAPPHQPNEAAHFTGATVRVAPPAVAPWHPMRRTGWWMDILWMAMRDKVKGRR